MLYFKHMKLFERSTIMGKFVIVVNEKGDPHFNLIATNGQIIGTSEPTIIDYSEAEAVENVTPSLRRYALIGALIGVSTAQFYKDKELPGAHEAIPVPTDPTIKDE